jgi:PiT family inorganic phosphate transporter
MARCCLPSDSGAFKMPTWIPLACYSTAAGYLKWWLENCKTMGSKITKVTSFEGVAAETAGALIFTEHLKIH